MTLLLTIALVAVIGRLGIWLVLRRRRMNLGSNVSAQWLSQQEYDRDGDDQQST